MTLLSTLRCGWLLRDRGLLFTLTLLHRQSSRGSGRGRGHGGKGRGEGRSGYQNRDSQKLAMHAEKKDVERENA